MNTFLPKLNSVCLIVISVSLAIIAYNQLQPNYVETKEGRFVDTRSGKIYMPSGSQLLPAPDYETTEQELRRKYPDGKKYWDFPDKSLFVRLCEKGIKRTRMFWFIACLCSYFWKNPATKNYSAKLPCFHPAFANLIASCEWWLLN